MFIVYFVCPVTSTAPNYRVLDTDYTGYSIVYNCHTLLGLFKTGGSHFQHFCLNLGSESTVLLFTVHPLDSHTRHRSNID